MSWKNAITTTPDGITLLLHITPNSTTPLFPGPYNPWRNTIDIHLTTPPTNNQANHDLITHLATFFTIQKKHITIIKGHTTRTKTIHIHTTNPQTFIKKIEEAYHGL